MARAQLRDGEETEPKSGFGPVGEWARLALVIPLGRYTAFTVSVKMRKRGAPSNETRRGLRKFSKL